jgi:hypothetical protein
MFLFGVRIKDGSAAGEGGCNIGEAWTLIHDNYMSSIRHLELQHGKEIVGNALSSIKSSMFDSRKAAFCPQSLSSSTPAALLVFL